MPRVGFEPTISAGERSKTYALDRAAIGTGVPAVYCHKILLVKTYFDISPRLILILSRHVTLMFPNRYHRSRLEYWISYVIVVLLCDSPSDL